jgi:ribonucleoside-diphosphate reductase alpha chain
MQVSPGEGKGCIDMRERLENVRAGWTHKAVIHSAEYGRVKLFVTVNRFPDGRLGEVFITADASGSTLDGFCDAWSTAISMLLQHGETIDDLERKFGYGEFEPKGMTDSAEVRYAKSVPDYVIRWMKAMGEAAAGAGAGGAATGAVAATEPTKGMA